MNFSWQNLGVLSGDVSLKISQKYPHNVLTEDSAKYCFKNEWTLVIMKISYWRIENFPAEIILPHCASIKTQGSVVEINRESNWF